MEIERKKAGEREIHLHWPKFQESIWEKMKGKGEDQKSIHLSSLQPFALLIVSILTTLNGNNLCTPPPAFSLAAGYIIAGVDHPKNAITHANPITFPTIRLRCRNPNLPPTSWLVQITASSIMIPKACVRKNRKHKESRNVRSEESPPPFPPWPATSVKVWRSPERAKTLVRWV